MLQYSNYTDEQLIGLLREGRFEIGNYLLEKYKNLVRKKARALFIIGGDHDDLMQEGMIGLFKAMQNYDASRGASFATFADLCITRQLYKAVEASSRQKHQPLSNYVSIYDEDSDTVHASVLSDSSALSMQNPEELIIDLENTLSVHEQIRSRLSKFEKEVLEQYLSGMNYTEIADYMGKPLKTIDNAIQRIRKKAREIV